jgi:hypothetical protein
MKIHQTLSLLIITFSLRAQSLTFGSTSSLFHQNAASWELSQPMIPKASSDGKYMDFYGLAVNNILMV